MNITLKNCEELLIIPEISEIRVKKMQRNSWKKWNEVLISTSKSLTNSRYNKLKDINITILS